MMTQEHKELLTVEQVAKMLQVNKRTIGNMVHRGELHAYKIAGRFRFESTTIEAFLRAHQVKPKEDTSL